MTAVADLCAALDGAIPGSAAAFGVQVGAPSGPGWHAPPRPAEVASWCADVPAALGVAEQLGTAVLGRAVAALALTGRAFDVADLALHRHERGYFDAAALRRPVVLVGPDLPGRVAAGAVATLGPMLDAIVAATRPAPLWDVVADATRGAATVLDLHGHPSAPDVADAVVAALAAHGAPVRSAPRQVVVAAGRSFEMAVRITCCLLWTGVPAADRAAAYCTTCPHLDEPTRADRFTTYAEEVRGRHGRPNPG